jgi:hypothetical protein
MSSFILVNALTARHAAGASRWLEAGMTIPQQAGG